MYNNLCIGKLFTYPKTLEYVKSYYFYITSYQFLFKSYYITKFY